jgi:hypothetical protein
MSTKPKTTRTPRNLCLNCGKEIDAATPTEQAHARRSPKPGDVALCLDCAHIHIFADDLTLREPTGDEIVVIAGDRDVVRAVNAIGELKRRENRR